MASMCNSSGLKAGDMFYLPEYYLVREVGDEMLDVIDLDSCQHQSISKSILDEHAEPTAQFTKEEKVTMTKLAAILKSAGDSPFRVTFNKATKAEDMVTFIDSQCAAENKAWGELPTSKKRKIAKKVMEGEERVMHARLVRNEAGDSRTIKELILRGVRYHL
jgi:hypothetical protein